MPKSLRILYCNCTYAKVVPEATKQKVLQGLCEQGVDFESVPDLCEMSAQRDPALKRLVENLDKSAENGAPRLKIAACYPRAVKWLFHAAGHDLPENAAEVHNMRTEEPQIVLERLLTDTKRHASADDKSPDT